MPSTSFGDTCTGVWTGQTILSAVTTPAIVVAEQKTTFDYLDRSLTVHARSHLEVGGSLWINATHLRYRITSPNISGGYVGYDSTADFFGGMNLFYDSSGNHEMGDDGPLHNLWSVTHDKVGVFLFHVEAQYFDAYGHFISANSTDYALVVYPECVGEEEPPPLLLAHNMLTQAIQQAVRFETPKK